MHDDLAQQLDKAKARAEKAGWSKPDISTIIRDEVRDRNEQKKYNPHPTDYGDLNKYLEGRGLDTFDMPDDLVV